MDEESKKWIDNASYETLLRRWRFSPSGDPFMQGDLGDYYAKVMFTKKRELSDADAAAISRRIGWEG